ncbi:MAG: galactitol-1-phosphate 5-dehydrogenase [Rectinemataceae bacterium]
MKALVLTQDKKLEYTTVPDPRPPSVGEVLVAVKYAGICGSDIPRGFQGGAYHYPLIMGHEFSGVVEAAGTGSTFSRGDRVTAFPLLPCGSCGACQTGNYAQCEHYDYLGSRRDGSFADFVLVPEANLFRMPDKVELLSGAMTEPCAVALHGVEKLSIRAGMSALVIGAGPIGSMAAQWLRIKGCGRVYVADIDRKKLDIAKELGFFAIDSSTVDLPDEIRRLEPQGGVDCSVEAVGLPATFLQALQCASRFGQVVFMGNIRGAFTVPQSDFSQLLRNELVIMGTWNSKVTPRGKDEWTRVLGFMDTEIHVAPLVSHRPRLSEGVEIFSRMVSRSEWFNKVVFTI